MTWKHRKNGSWTSPTIKKRRGGEWVTVSGGGGSGINVGSPGAEIFSSPMDSQTEIDRFDEVKFSSNISPAADPEGLHGNTTQIYVGSNDTRGGTVAWCPNEVRDGTRTGENDPDSVYAQHYVYFPADTQMYDPNENSHGTKMGGIAGYYNDAGNGGTKGDGYSWSARCQTDVIEENTSNSGFTMNYFPYHMDQPGTYGDKEPWSGTYQFGQWHKFTYFVQMNTPGEYDGILRGWANDQLQYERTNFRFRSTDHPNVGVTRTYAGYIYWGGSWGSPKNQNVYFRDHTLTHG